MVTQDGTLIVLDNSFSIAPAVVRIDTTVPAGANNCRVISRGGSGGTPAIGDGPVFFSPTGVAVEAQGNLVVVDDFFNAIVRVISNTGDREITPAIAISCRAAPRWVSSSSALETVHPSILPKISPLGLMVLYG